MLGPHELLTWKLAQKSLPGDLSGDPVSDTPPANAEDTGSIPGPGGSSMLWGSDAHVPQPLGLCSGAGKLQQLSSRAAPPDPALLEPMPRKRRSHCSEQPTQHP